MRFVRPRVAPIAPLLALVLCAGCARRAPVARAGGPRDDYGEPIRVGSRAPARIVSLNPTTTEILFAIGASARLVGRSEWDTFPDSARRVPSLGAALRPNVEAVLADRPDLVVLYASADDRPAYDRLRDAGVPTVGLKIDSIAQFARDALLLGRLTHDSAAAATLVDTVTATLARVRAATAALPRPTIFVHTWDRPIIAIGGGSFMSELLAIAGARNVYADSPAPSLAVSLEDVARRDPDYILAGPDAAAAIRASAEWRAVRAVRIGHVLSYDMDLVTRPSVQLGEAAVALAALFHPGAVH